MSFRSILHLACVAGPFVFWAGCLMQRVMTPAELEQHESRAFAGQSKAKVFDATTTAEIESNLPKAGSVAAPPSPASTTTPAKSRPPSI